MESLVRKILFTLGMILIVRIGSYIPIIGFNPAIMENLASSSAIKKNIIQMMNNLSGGSFNRMSIFALSIFPYITSSIVIQLMTSVVPYLETLKKGGESGVRTINQITRCLTVVIALIQSIPIVSIFISSPLFIDKAIGGISLLTGTLFVMWCAEKISEKGLGNGSSIIIFTSIIANTPSAFIQLFEMMRNGLIQLHVGVIELVLFCCITVIVIYFEYAIRKVTILHPSQKFMRSQSSNFVPVKINVTGVMPPMFARIISGVIIMTISSYASYYEGVQNLSFFLGSGKVLLVLINVFFLVVFGFFFSTILFDPENISNNLKKQNVFVPLVRPGEKTRIFFEKIITRLTAISVVYLSVVCVILPQIFLPNLMADMTLGGTSILILVSVVVDTFSQIQMHLHNKQYSRVTQRMVIR